MWRGLQRRPNTPSRRAAKAGLLMAVVAGGAVLFWAPSASADVLSVTSSTTLITNQTSNTTTLTNIVSSATSTVSGVVGSLTSTSSSTTSSSSSGICVVGACLLQPTCTASVGGSCLLGSSTTTTTSTSTTSSGVCVAGVTCVLQPTCTASLLNQCVVGSGGGLPSPTACLVACPTGQPSPGTGATGSTTGTGGSGPGSLGGQSGGGLSPLLAPDTLPSTATLAGGGQTVLDGAVVPAAQALGPVSGLVFGHPLVLWPLFAALDLVALAGLALVVWRRWASPAPD